MLFGVPAVAAAQEFLPFELGLGSGRALCRVGGVVGTVTDEFEGESEARSAECIRGLEGIATQAIVSTAFLPAIADAVVLAERSNVETALQVTAKSEFEFALFLVPVGEPVAVDAVQVDAAVRYSLASLVDGGLAGGCSALLVIEQTIGQ